MVVRIRALIAIVCCVAMVAPSGAAGGHGGLYVTSLPPAASVWLDGVYLGETPLYLDGLDAGRHVLTMTRSGWQPQSTPVDVSVGRVATLSVVLTSNQPPLGAQGNKPRGTLIVRDAGTARVSVDGAALTGSMTSQSLDSGEHILSVQRGNTRTTSSVRIYPQMTTVVSVAPRGSSNAQTQTEDMLAALQDYVPVNDFSVNGDEITVHFKGVELECAVGSHSYVLNGKPGSLTVAPAMVGTKPYLPLSLLNRIIGPVKSAAH